MMNVLLFVAIFGVTCIVGILILCLFSNDDRTINKVNTKQKEE